MLSKTHGEDSGIKTVTLARGVLTDSSSPAPTSLPRLSFERLPPGAIIERDEEAGASNILGEVGIIELLEQDARPTFIVDLAEASNFGPNPLHVIFTNIALRANPKWLELVTGEAIDPGGPPTSNPGSPASHRAKTFRHFKSWLLSASSHGESLDVCLPSFLYSGIAWSCSTVRKRFRVISASSILSGSPTQAQPPSSLSLPKSSSFETVIREKPERDNEEPSDYFGAAAPPRSSQSRSSENAAQQDRPTAEVTEMHSMQPPDLSKVPYMGRNGRIFNQTDGIIGAMDASPSLTAEIVLGSTIAADIDPFKRSPSASHLSLPLSNVSPNTPGSAQGFFDWTRLPVSDELPAHIRFARSVDWASTSLGPIENWPPDLRQMCNLIMASPHPASMYWGDDLVAIYNEAYVLLAGQKHPWLMGQNYRDAWAEIWEEVKDVFASARQTGEATMKVSC